MSRKYACFSRIYQIKNKILLLSVFFFSRGLSQKTATILSVIIHQISIPSSVFIRQKDSRQIFCQFSFWSPTHLMLLPSLCILP